jgi:hypothetical protein
MERDNFPGFHRRPAAANPHVCARCGGYAPLFRLCEACQVSQVEGAGFIFGEREPERREATRF